MFYEPNNVPVIGFDSALLQLPRPLWLLLNGGVGAPGITFRPSECSPKSPLVRGVIVTGRLIPTPKPHSLGRSHTPPKLVAQYDG